MYTHIPNEKHIRWFRRNMPSSSKGYPSMFEEIGELNVWSIELQGCPQGWLVGSGKAQRLESDGSSFVYRTWKPLRYERKQTPDSLKTTWHCRWLRFVMFRKTHFHGLHRWHPNHPNDWYVTRQSFSPSLVEYNGTRVLHIHV